MYQQSKIVVNLPDNAEEEFGKLINIFKENVALPDILNKDDSEWNLDKSYDVNHACIWNKPSNIGRECYIIQKTNELALVMFQDDSEITQDKIYRLEDLS